MEAKSQAPRRPGRGYWFSLLAIAAFVRALIVFIPLGTMPLVSDAFDYFDQARRLLADFPGDRAYFWPPGTPFFLALIRVLFGPSVAAARLGMIALSVATVALAALIADRVSSERRVVESTGWLGALYPPAILMSSQTYSQNLAAFLVALLAWALLSALATRRLVWWALSGIALGLGCLTRPSMLAYVPILIGALIALLVRTRRAEARSVTMRNGLVALVGCVLPVLPVMIHNAHHRAGWTIATNNERNFFLGNNRYTPLYKTSQLAERPLEDLGPEGLAYVSGMTNENDVAARRAMTAEAVRHIRRDPLRTLLRTINRARAFWGFDYLLSRRIQIHYHLGTMGLIGLLIAEAGGYVALLLLVLAGLSKGWNGFAIGGGKLLALLAFTYMLPYTIAFSGGTYHFPVVGLLLPFAGVALDRGIRRDTAFWARTMESRAFRTAAAVFLLIQLESAYFTFAHRA